jgi:hypothetical protein
MSPARPCSECRLRARGQRECTRLVRTEKPVNKTDDVADRTRLTSVVDVAGSSEICPAISSASRAGSTIASVLPDWGRPRFALGPLIAAERVVGKARCSALGLSCFGAICMLVLKGALNIESAVDTSPSMTTSPTEPRRGTRP